MQGGMKLIPDSHPHTITSTKCHIDTVISPDDGHTVRPKHVEKRNRRTKKNCAPSWLCLQQFTVFHHFTNTVSCVYRTPPDDEQVLVRNM